MLEAARKHAQRGAQEKALKEYHGLLRLDPRDAKLRLEIGDAFRRWGQIDEAIESYTKVAQQYSDEGFDARAVAVYKQIQNLDADRYDSYEPLADLYQRMGLLAEASAALQTAADGYRRNDKKPEALGLLRKMASLDPTNTTSRIKVADLLAQEGMDEEAIGEYSEAVAELERQGDVEASEGVYTRILELDADHLPTLVGYARSLIGRGQADQAEPMARHALEVGPEEPEHYEVLAEIYRAGRREEEMADVYRRLAELYKERGDEGKARDIMQRFVPVGDMALGEDSAFGTVGETGLAGDAGDVVPDLGGEPLDTGDAGADLGSEPLDTGDAGADLGGDALLLEDDGLLDRDFGDQELLLEDRPLGAELEGDPLLAEQTLSGVGDGIGADPRAGDSLADVSLGGDPLAPPAAEDEAPTIVRSEPGPLPQGDPEQLLAEASVYLRYGKRDQAIANLRGVLAQDPDHRAALEKLGEALAADGDSAGAVEAWLRAGVQARESGDLEALGVLRDRVAALDEVAAAQLLPPIAAEPEASPAPEPEPAPALEDDDIEIELDDDEFEDGGEDVGAEAQAVLDAARGEEAPTGLPLEDHETRPDGASASASLSEQVIEDLEEADFYMEQGLHGEAEAIYRRLLELAPNHPRVLVRLGEIAAARGDDPGSTSGPTTPPAVPDEPDTDLGVSTEELYEADDSQADVAEAERTAQGDVVVGGGGIETQPDVEIEIDDGIEEEVETIGPGIDSDLDDVIDEDLDGVIDAAEEAALAETDDAPVLAPPDDVLPTDDDVIAPDDDVIAPTGDVIAPTGDDSLDITAAPSAGSLEEGEGFDLAAELSEEFDDDPDGRSQAGSSDSGDDTFMSVFRDFKKGVSEALGDGDHQAHYDLGIAYREMGLLDDAMGEFKAASGSGEHRVDALHMLGLCAIDLERAEEAVDHLRAALATPEIAGEQRIAVQFGLGRAFEGLGDWQAARDSYEDVMAIDPLFCGVEERLAELGAKQADAPEPVVAGDDSLSDGLDEALDAEEATADPGFESFEDLFVEAEAEPEPAIEAPTPEAEPEAESEPEPAAEPVPEPAAAPEPAPAPPRKSKKKIGFL